MKKETLDFLEAHQSDRPSTWREEAQKMLDEIRQRADVCRKQIADTEDLIMNATRAESIPWDEILEQKKRDLQRLKEREARFANMLK